MNGAIPLSDCESVFNGNDSAWQSAIASWIPTTDAQKKVRRALSSVDANPKSLPRQTVLPPSASSTELCCSNRGAGPEYKIVHSVRPMRSGVTMIAPSRYGIWCFCAYAAISLDWLGVPVVSLCDPAPGGACAATSYARRSADQPDRSRSRLCTPAPSHPLDEAYARSNSRCARALCRPSPGLTRTSQIE